MVGRPREPPRIADTSGVVLASKGGMDTHERSRAAGDLVRRIEGEYREMPGLNLTLAQAERLWGVDQPTCLRVLTLLVTRRVLKRTQTGTYLRAG